MAKAVALLVEVRVAGVEPVGDQADTPLLAVSQ